MNNIDLEIQGGVATLTLNRPERLNALSPELRADFEAALADLKPGDSVKVIRVRGAGRGFCSGYDMSSGQSVYSMAPQDAGRSEVPGAVPMAQMGEGRAVLDRERIREGIERWIAVANYRKPIVAQVHGVCLAGGLDLIGVSDVVYSADNARFGHPAARGLGIPPTLGMLPLKIGVARTKELLFTGDVIDGLQAERWGLVNRTFAEDELDTRTMELCQRMALNTMDALNLHKSVANRWADLMGQRDGALVGAEYDALFHVSPASEEFGRIAGGTGLREALAWRDGPFKQS